MELLIFIFCCYLNYNRAKQANLNGGRWAFYTFIAIFGTLLIGAAAILIYLVSNDPQMQSLVKDMSSSRDDEAIKQYVTGKLSLLNQLFMFFCGIGGYLFVRYFLNKKIGTVSE